MQDRSEDEIRRAYVLSDHALELTSAGYWHIDFKDPDYYIASERTRIIFGEAPRPDLRYHLQDEWFSRLAAADETIAKATSEHLADVLSGGSDRYDATYPYKRPEDGRVIWCRAVGTIERDASGKPTYMYGVEQDITDQRLAELALAQERERLEESEGRLEGSAIGANLGLWDVNVATGDILVNAIFESQLKYPPLALRETNDKWARLRGGLTGWPAMMHPDDREHVVGQITRFLDGGVPTYQNEHRVRLPGGAYKWLLSVGRAFAHDAAGKPTRVIGVHIDIDQMKALQADIEHKYVELQKLQHLHDNLTHMIVHDLRSPLTGIKAYLDLLKLDEGKLDADGKSYIRGALTGTSTLVEMISSLLDVNRLESGEMPLHKKEVNLSVLADEALKTMGGHLVDRKLLREYPKEPLPATCDADLVRRVIANLMGNALKFTPEDGTITVAIAANNGTCRVEVRDTGPGIPPAYRAKIFDKFGQVDEGERKQLSTGLGLTFCKLVVEAHGGTIGVDSTVGKGSTFWFELPS